MFNFAQKIKSAKWEIAIILIIFAVGIFLRTYNFSDWLHFEIDQDYDILLVDRAATNGISNLPLLGPNAGGGLLRLGPAYYYLQYLSAKIFGNTPSGNAVFVLIFSVLALPLFYRFCRRYFEKSISVGLLAIFSVSLFSVLYSRFAWSSNVLPFLMLLAFYALLKSVSKDEKRGEMWFLVSIFTTAIITQIHFNVFFIVPIIFFVFLLIKRPHFRLRTWLIALGIILLVYSPVILSDLKTNGQNLNYFLGKTGKGVSANYSAQLTTKLVQNIQYFSSEYFLINSGLDHINGGRIKDLGFKNDKNLPWRIGAMILFFAELFFLVKNFFRFKQKNEKEKDFLIICGLWFSVFFLYFFYLLANSYNMFPRFFLPLSPLAVIFLGFLFQNKKQEIGKKRLVFFSLTVAAFCISNLIGIRQYFDQLSNAKTNSIKIETEDVLPNTARATLSQQNKVADYIKSIERQNNFPVYIETLHEIEPAIWYQLEKAGIEYWRSFPGDYAYRQGNYFMVFPTEKNRKSLWHYESKETKTFGSLCVTRIVPRPNFIIFERQDISTKILLETKEEFNQIYTWKELFQGKKIILK
jgi:4-amino-4-deoxy-L-arabinose transferase-like glycosyltransferase